MTKKKSNGLHFSSRFAATKKDPFSLVEWEKRHCQINGASGQVVFSLPDVEAPKSWSDLAVNIAASKYFRRSDGKIRDANHPPLENSVKKLIGRVTRTIRQAGETQKKIFATKADADHFENELIAILVSQRGAFNSPVWFNCGLYEAYKIKGHSGNFRFDPKMKRSVNVENAYEYPQCSACFIQSVDDDLTDIFELLKKEARVFKYGSGTGTNFSKIRSQKEPLAGGGFSSGLMSFLDVFDRAAAATKSGGVTRRAAKMVCLNLDHPEIKEFIWWKVKEEEKAVALLEAGFSGGFEGEAYRTVSGQNSNNSVRITDQFIRAVEKDQSWKLKAPSSGQVIEEISARELWRQIATAAWRCADPGVQFHDTIQKWHTCPETGPIEASNPCSEYMFLDDSACNLASINLKKFFDGSGKFDLESFRHTARILFVAQEILVDLSSYPTAKIAENSHAYRPLGLGYANLGASLMSLGVAYDSEMGREIAALITAALHGEALNTSAELASVRGAFKGYARNKKAMQSVIKKHHQHAKKICASRAISNWKNIEACRVEVKALWQQVLNQGQQFGFRNAQVTVLAPTGTIGLLMDCDTTGIEPEFSLYKSKQLSGGGQLILVNGSFRQGLKALGYPEAQIAKIESHLLKHHSLVNAPFIEPEHLSVFDCAQKSAPTDRCLAASAHLKMMAAVQPFLSGAISKTVNLPADVTVEQIQEIYFQAWKLGLKSVAVYRDMSKSSQVLSIKPQIASSPRGRQSVKIELSQSAAFAPDCYQCGVRSTPNGNCFRCLNCGTSLGCS